MGPRDTDGSTNKVFGTGVGVAVDVGKVVGEGTIVELTVAAAVGVCVVPHPASRSEINVTIVKVRCIGVSKTFLYFIPIIH